MTDRTGDASNRGAVLMLTSTVGEVETAQVASNLRRAMELAGTPLDSGGCRRPGTGLPTDQPLAPRASGNEHSPSGPKT